MASTGLPRQQGEEHAQGVFEEDERTTDITSCPTLPNTVPSPSMVPRIYAAEEAAEEPGPADQTELNPLGSRQAVASAALPANVRAWFELRGGPVRSECPIPLTTIRTSIGRGTQADICIRDAKLSRKHTTVFYNGQEFRIRDEGSSNGTLLNGSRVVEYALHDGDEVVVGSTKLVFKMALQE